MWWWKYLYRRDCKKSFGRGRIKIKELWLYDIDQERQEKVSLIVKEVVKDLRPSLELKISTDEEEAFTDADFIMAQMRVGGLKASKENRFH